MAAALLLALASFAGRPGPTAVDPHGQKSESACDYEHDGPLFVAALARFRGGDAGALEELMGSALRLAAGCGRDDALAIARFYRGLDPVARANGHAAELHLDALRARASELDLSTGPPLIELQVDVASLATDTEHLDDRPVHAHVLTLQARLQMRELEGLPDSGSSLDRAAEARAWAAEAVRLFEGAGQVTPTLEPLWIEARGALLCGDLGAADEAFSTVADIAASVNRPTWRERGILGAIGTARERGSVFDATLLLEELASFRAPESCWSLAREVAVQRVTADDGEAALGWLQRFPPSPLDDEIQLDVALEEWRALVVAAELRMGRVGEAAARMDAFGGSGAAETSVERLARAAIYLESDEPQLALEVLDAASGGWATHDQSTAEALSLRGRALLRLGRPSEAAAALEKALAAALPHVPLQSVTDRRGTASHSRVGEWLGLSSVEALARAYVALGDPLAAAAVIEAAHAPDLDRAACRAMLVQLACSSTLGLVTWIAGADQSLAIYIDPTGASSAHPIPLGRPELMRGAGRLRDALRSAFPTRPSAQRGIVDERWRSLSHQLYGALLPTGACHALESPPVGGASETSLVLLLHGALERIPFEALLPRTDSTQPLGAIAALSVRNRLRDLTHDVARPFDASRASWTGLGAAPGPWAELRGAQRELVSLARMWPRWRSLDGEEATLDATRRALAIGGSVHFATHVIHVPRGEGGEATISPLALALAHGESLSADAIRSLRPKLPLAVLTACGSAEGNVVDGLSVRGVAQAFLDSGTRSTLVTLWPIQDQAGERAAVRLHAALMAGASPAEAARRTRRFLADLGEPPSEWAAYRCLE